MKSNAYRFLLKILLLCTAFSLLLSACASPRPSPVNPITSPRGPQTSPSASTPRPITTVARDDAYWKIQDIAWGANAEIYSSLVADARHNPHLLYADRTLSQLTLAVLVADGWKYYPLGADTQGAVYPSLVLDAEERARFAFFQSEDSAILYGQQTGDGWQYEKVLEDKAVEVAALTLVIDPGGQPVIVYSDSQAGQLFYAFKSSGGWEKREIAKARVANTLLPARYGPDQRLRLVYNDRDRGLLYLTLQEDGQWQSEVIAPGGVTGRFPALAFSADGSPYVSYHDPVNGQLICATRTGGEWQNSVVDSTPGTGKYSAIVVDAGHQAHISYSDETNGTLKYASGRGTSWTTWTVDEHREINANTALLLGADGYPRILYHDERIRALRVATMSLWDAPENRAKLSAAHRRGQTFLTWMERQDLQNEVYRVYRAGRPIHQASDLSSAQLLAQLGEQSGQFYANFHDEGDHVTWRPRYTENYVISPGQLPLPDDTGLLVWTLSAEDLDGKDSGAGYYAVTVTPPGGKETLPDGYQTGPVEEKVDLPQPVEISRTPGMNADPRRHIYVQFMDLRRWNATFHAPNPTNSYYGFPPGTPGFAGNLQYAYDYTVFEPSQEECGGQIPDKLPVNLFLHGYRGNRYGEVTQNSFPYCAYTILPIDVTETWYFGFAQKHDFRQGGEIAAGDVIENYTEQRVLRMVHDLLLNPPGPPADEQRVYVFGHSMGGSGALAFAERYPNVFAGAYSGQPITDYATAGDTDRDWAADVALKWGKPALNLPIAISAPADWADPIQKYNGSGVWDWQNYLAGISRQAADTMVPLGVDHGTVDEVILWDTQGKPMYTALDSSMQAWSGLVNDADHEWSNFAGMSSALGNTEDILPFWNFTMIRDETVPGISNLRPNPVDVEGKGSYYNHTLLWSSSWNPWDGAPIDEPGRWQMSFCAGKPSSEKCDGVSSLTVNITPRRIQKFQITSGKSYIWKNLEVATGLVTDSGMVTAGPQGLITVGDVVISPSGSRLLIEAEP